jgi:hypothetical protein
MRRLVEQIRQVAVVYVSRPVTLFWVGTIVLFGLLDLCCFGIGEPFHTLIYSSWLLILLNEQLSIQFAHPRSRLMPSFCVPHLILPIVGCIAIGLVLPAMLAHGHQKSTWQWMAVSSAGVLGMFTILRFPKYSWLIWGAILGPMLFGYSIFDLQFNLSPALCAAVLVAIWATIAAVLFRIAHVREDELAIQFAVARLASSQGGSTRYQRTASRALTSKIWFPTERWHDHIGGYHTFRRRRIVRLLRYGFSSTPAGIQAITTAAGYLVGGAILIYLHRDGEDDGSISTLWINDCAFSHTFPQRASRSAIE